MSGVEDGIHELHLEVPRQARLALLGSPEGEPEELWIVLHGYRQLARRFLRPFSAIATPGRRVVAPEGHSRFYLEGAPGPHRSGDPVGASWMTREDRESEIRDYVAYLDRVWRRFGGAGVPLTVLGFSQGVHTAARWIATGEVPGLVPGQAGPPPRLILWGAALPRDLPAGAGSRFRGLRELVLVRGEEDRLRNRDDEAWEEAWLQEEEVEAHHRSHPGAHRLSRTLLAELAGGPGQNSPTNPISGTSS
jgi:predicted esterase